MAVITGWGCADPWQNESACPGWHKRMIGTLWPWRFINHKPMCPAGLNGRFMPLVFAMQQDVHSAAALTTIPAGKLHCVGNEGEHDGDGSNVAPDVAAEFSRAWLEQRGPNFAPPGFGTWWDRGFDWADAYMRAGGWIGKTIQVSSYAAYGADFIGQIERLEAWMAKWKVTAKIILREVNAWPNAPDMQRGQVMEAVRAMLDAKRIIQAYWFPTYYGPAWTTGSLLNADGSLRFWGRNWIEMGQP